MCRLPAGRVSGQTTAGDCTSLLGHHSGCARRYDAGLPPVSRGKDDRRHRVPGCDHGTWWATMAAEEGSIPSRRSRQHGRPSPAMATRPGPVGHRPSRAVAEETSDSHQRRASRHTGPPGAYGVPDARVCRRNELGRVRIGVGGNACRTDGGPARRPVDHRSAPARAERARVEPLGRLLRRARPALRPRALADLRRQLRRRSSTPAGSPSTASRSTTSSSS